MSLYLDDFLDVSMLHDHIEKGNIKVQDHPTEPLRILNYTAQCQYTRAWDDVTRQCRGLIVENFRDRWIVHARPFPKFFNYGEHEPGEFDLNDKVYAMDKLDGSLGILYQRPSDRQYAIATRGSFTSDQAIRGTELLKEWIDPENLVRDFFPREDFTYLFEIIYPENRIVVDYKGYAGLVCLGAIDNHSGLLWGARLAGWNGKIPEPAPAKTLGEALALEPRENAEGLVLRFPGKQGLMLKIKQEDYVELHRLITGLNEKVIWEKLNSGMDTDDICSQVPEEFHEFIQGVADDLYRTADTIENIAYETYENITREILKTPEYRKLFAERAVQSKSAPFLFHILDGKSIEPLIWKGIKPKVTKTLLAITEDNS